MTEKEVADRLLSAKELYCINGESPLSDAEYDALEDQLREMNPDHQHFSTVGVSSDALSIIHRTRMLTCNSKKKVPDIISWYSKALTHLGLNYDDKLLILPKVDGQSGEVTYNNGELVSVTSRGDGYQGQNYHKFLDHIISIPKKLPPGYPGICEFRGEFLISKNTPIKKKARRNYVAGLLNRGTASDDHDIIDFVSYNMICNGLDTPTYESELKYIVDAGFQYLPYLTVSGIRNLGKSLDIFMKAGRGNTINKLFKSMDCHESMTLTPGSSQVLDYEIDGTVITLDDKKAWYAMNSTKPVTIYNHYQVAIKPVPRGINTPLLDITWSIGKTGEISPMGNVKQSPIGDRSVSRVPLFSINNLKKHKVEIGDVLYVELANDITPMLTTNVSGATRSDYNVLNIIPKKCPSCGGRTKVLGARLYCTNQSKCPDVQIYLIEHWCKRLKIRGLGYKSIKALYASKAVVDIITLYTVKETELANALGKKNAVKILKQLDDPKLRPKRLKDIIVNLGIPLVSENVIDKLDPKFDKNDMFVFNRDSSKACENLDRWSTNNIKMLKELSDVMLNIDADI